MRSTLLALVLIAVAVLLPVLSRARQEASSTSRTKAEKHASFVSGELLVRFRSESEPAKRPRSAIAVNAGGREIDLQLERLGPDEIVPGLRLAHVAAGDIQPALEALRSRPDVLYAEPNFVRHKSALPNDPRFPEMWGLKNTGQPVGGHPGGVGLDIHAEQAWDITTGSRSVVVGVIDEGIDVSHPDLHDNIWQNPGEIPNNGVDDDSNGFVDDTNGWDFVHNDKTVFDGSGNYPADQTDAHGTHVAGTIGATGNNGSGVVGVNWQVSLMSLKFLNAAGSGSTSDLIRAYAYAKTMRDLWTSSGGTRGANIRALNNSYGGTDYSQAEFEAISAIANSEILFVAAAGNDGTSNDIYHTYPANYRVRNIISVAASNNGDGLASFSNVGGATVSLAAPGAGILSTTPNGTYDTYRGTSMAAPHVTGAAALVTAAFPNISMAQLRNVLIYSGDVVPVFTSLASGRRLNVANALQAAAGVDTTPPGAVTNLQLSNPFFTVSTLTWGVTGDDGNSGVPAAYQLRVADVALDNPLEFEVATPLGAPFPNPPITFSDVNVQFPWRHPNGYYCVRAMDDAGNAGPISCAPYSVRGDIGDPYQVIETPSTTLSTGGTPLQLIGDDLYTSYFLPFPFKFFGQTRTFNSVNVSINGTLYADQRNSGDFENSTASLSAWNVIAGLWDDLRTDRRTGDDVYVVTPDSDTVIFRWQAVTYDTLLDPTTHRGENPVNFEIELKRNGTITIRYGDGNRRLLPVVGLGGGVPDPYIVDSHTSEFQLTDLTFAPNVTFSFRPIPQVSITGRVVAPNNVGMSGVTMNLGGFSVGTTQTVADGSFAFNNLQAGQGYTVSAFLAGINFSPLSQSFNVLNTNAVVEFHAVLPANPIDDSRTFIRQHYLDFLNREPDPGGWDYWTGNITQCGTDARCIHNHRIDVSAAFFMELDFQETGYVVYRMHRAALGTWPGGPTRANVSFATFMADRSLLVAGSGLPQSTIDFANAFVQRQKFIDK